MAEDIFIPKSKPEDALVGPLHMVTYITADKGAVEKSLIEGYGLTGAGWETPSANHFKKLNKYLGFGTDDSWEVSSFYKQGAGANGHIRVIHVHQETPLVRPVYDGLYTGGATISFPIDNLRAHEKIMDAIGIESTIGVKEMEFQSPTGETYISAEIVYKAPDNVFLLGVTRPDKFVPVGPLDPKLGLGGPAYSARCVTDADKLIAFLQIVMGYEIRRDIELTVGEKSAILMPEGTKERFIQAFAPGAATGYLVLMDHGPATKHSPAPQLGPPSRGIGMWSFGTVDIEEVFRRAKTAGVDVIQAPSEMGSPFLPDGRSMMMKDPQGFPIEVFEQ